MRDEISVVKFAKKEGYDGAGYVTDWKGYHVYDPILDWVEKSDKPASIGLPLVILEKGQRIRMSTPDECMEFLDYRIELEGDEDE